MRKRRAIWQMRYVVSIYGDRLARPLGDLAQGVCIMQVRIFGLPQECQRKHAPDSDQHCRRDKT